MNLPAMPRSTPNPHPPPPPPHASFLLKTLTSSTINPFEVPFDSRSTIGRSLTQPRWWLRIKAVIWRFLMSIGILFDYLRIPNPPRPSFSRSAPVLTYCNSSRRKTIKLQFYVPKDYHAQRRTGRRYPIVIDFHGGGFTLGSATDDGFWARVVVRDMDAVFVSVGYRKAPEDPFPAAVDDGVDAIYYLAEHSQELGLDPTKISLTGFSAGANLAITVPMRLQYRQKPRSDELQRQESLQTLLEPVPDPIIVSVIAWYPILDFAKSRAERRAASVRPDKALSTMFTDLFDQSYLPDPSDAFSPFVSPLLAPDDMLDLLPNDVEMLICEWDMLYMEGVMFAERLKRVGKNIGCTVIPQARHAFDRDPSPFRNQKVIDEHYQAACDRIRAHFENADD